MASTSCGHLRAVLDHSFATYLALHSCRLRLGRWAHDRVAGLLRPVFRLGCHVRRRLTHHESHSSAASASHGELCGRSRLPVQMRMEVARHRLHDCSAVLLGERDLSRRVPTLRR